MQRRVAPLLDVVRIRSVVMIIHNVYLVQIQVGIARGQIHVVRRDMYVQVMVRRARLVQNLHKVAEMDVIQVPHKYVVPTIKQFVIATKRVVVVIVAMLAQHA